MIDQAQLMLDKWLISDWTHHIVGKMDVKLVIGSISDCKVSSNQGLILNHSVLFPLKGFLFHKFTFIIQIHNYSTFDVQFVSASNAYIGALNTERVPRTSLNIV